MARKRRKRNKRNEVSSEELFRSNRDERTTRRRQRRGIMPRKWVVGLVLLAAFLFFLPAIVVRTPLKQLIINRALADFEGTVTVESISCGWITNTELRNVEGRDRQGELLFQVEAVKLRKSLTSMMNASDLGTIEVIRPVVNLNLRPDGSNLEDAVARMLSSEEDAAPAPAVRISVTDAQVVLTDATTSRSYEIDEIESLVEAFQPDEAPLRIGLEGKLGNDEVDHAGSFNARIVIDAGKDKVEFQNGLVELGARKFPIEIVTPLISRFVEPVAVSGIMNGDVVASWDGERSSFALQMKPASFADLVVAAPSRIGSDRIQLTNAWLQGQVTLTPGTLHADQLVCQTGIGSLNADGKMNWEQFAAVAGAGIPANNFQAEGSVNLAPLIAMLPDTLPLREGIAIESGTVQFNANSRVEGTDRRLVFNVESAGLTAIRDGQRLNWDKPARVVAAIRQTSDNAIYVESLDCTTNFLTLNGTATTEQGEFQVQGDLKSALAEVSRFFDLGDARIEGIVDGRFAWQFDGSPTDKLTTRPLRAGGRFHIDRPLVNLPGQTSWAEDEINLVIQAAGKMLPVSTANSRAIRLDSGKLELVNARQSFEASLVEPLVSPSLGSDWKLDCKLGGDVSTWLSQISTFIPVQAAATGSIDATALVTVSPGLWTVHRSNYEFKDLGFSGYSLTLNEPQVVGDAAMTWDPRTGVFQISDASIASSVLSARGQQIVLDQYGRQGALAGQVAFRTDINRCLAMFGQSAATDEIQWFGAMHGTIDLQTTAESIGGNVSINVDDLVAARLQATPASTGVQNVSAGQSWIRLLDEKLVSLDSSLSLDRSFDRLTFNNTQLKSSAAEVIVNGSISDLTGSMITSIEGTWQPDWPRLKPLVDSIMGGVASIDGVQGGGFQMTGPVFNLPADQSNQQGQSWIHPDLRVTAVASWQHGQVLGMPMSGSQLDLQLVKGVAVANTDPVSFGGGTIRLTPRLDLTGQEFVMFLPQGRVIENVELTQDICRGWMKYVAPMIADATAAQGRFSIDIAGAEVPLGRFDAARMDGHATLHAASVGPGPLSQQLIMVVEQVKALAKGQPLNAITSNSASNAWIAIPEQQVPFAIRDGRVIHQQMRFQVGDVEVMTSGSVGLDQTVQLVAAIPILEQWVGDSRWTQGLKGQTLQIPVSGTVSQPQVDRRALQQISQQIVQQAAGAAINQEVQGLIDQGNQRLEQEITKGLKSLLGGDK